ncbi:PHD-finger [Dictyocaulus viviparus]|uniref:PHD-finger n=1 Tax=Dictyocaulus viviparus TaxID=29172 RepID=A0A0D8Y1H2_DICVI|nr:PHD-finger [Dictyocaulus viviparus]
MQYLEDIVELVEDIPEEIGRRFELIRQWDHDVESKFIARYYVKLNDDVDKYRLIHRLSERKYELAVRSERLMSAVLEKVTDSSYLCKIELEVDNPGCTEAIERNFCRTLGLRPTSSHLTTCNMEFEPLDDMASTSSYNEYEFNGEISSSDSKETLRSRISNGQTDIEGIEIGSPMQFPYVSPQRGCTSAPKMKRRKHQSDPSQSLLTNHARKKQERVKTLRNNSSRQEEYRHKQQKSVAETGEPVVPLNSKNECVVAPGTIKTEVIDPSENDALCSEDDFDANDVMDLFPTLPSPPREIMESLNEDSLFLDDDHMSYDSNTKDYSQSPATPGILADSIPSSPSPSISVSSYDKKKRTSISFGNVNETASLHGRPRKICRMTERAVELLQNHKDKEKSKRKVDTVEADNYERWCFCREGSSGSMICCDDPECKYQWFHFECVGLTIEPKGQWFCSECSGKRHQRIEGPPGKSSRK